jgi:hypothetical protein
MITRNMKVSTISATRHATKAYPPGECRPNPFEVEDAGAGYSTENLGHHIGHEIGCRESLTDQQTDRYRGIQMASGYVTDGIRHRQDRKPEREGHAE